MKDMGFNASVSDTNDLETEINRLRQEQVYYDKSKTLIIWWLDNTLKLQESTNNADKTRHDTSLEMLSIVLSYMLNPNGFDSRLSWICSEVCEGREAHIRGIIQSSAQLYRICGLLWVTCSNRSGHRRGIW